MKKIYNFLALLLFCMAGTMSAYAQSDDTEYTWVIADEQIEAPSNGLQVVLHEGNYAYWAQNGYLNANVAKMDTPDETAIYELVEVGKATDGATLYVIKNVSNKQYITNGGHTLSFSEAFQCSIMKGYKDSENLRSKIYDGTDERQPGSDGNCWVLCSLDEDNNPTYLGYIGGCSYTSYKDTNDWLIYEVTKHESTPQEKLEKRYNNLFSNGCDETVFPVGENPGCVDQATYDKLLAAYTAACALLDNKTHTDAEILAGVALLDEAQEAYDANYKTVEAGKYYYFVNQRSQDAMYDNSGSLYCTASKSSLSSPLTLSDAKYIWKAEASGTKGYVTLQNYSSGLYIQTQGSTSSTFPLGSEDAVGITFTKYEGQKFLMTDENGNMLHNAGGMNVVRWQSTGTGNQWLIYSVSDDEVDALAEEVKKNRLITNLTSLVAEAQHLSAKYQNANGCTADGVYDSDAAGLVSTLAGANATESSEGSVAGLFDGKVNTYYHTKWNGATADNDYDWIQLDLGKELQKVTVKMTQRHNNANGNPSKIAWVAAADGEDPAGSWSDTLAVDTVIYEYSTPGISRSNTTAVFNIDFGKAVQNVRMAVLRTKANQIHGDLGPCWHLAELRIYEDLGVNPRYNMIPEATRNALTDAISHAQTVLADSTCTDADYDNLEAAMKAFKDAYPDDTELSEYIEEAKAQAEAENMEGDEWGYFEAGAQAELSTAIAAIESEVEANSPLSLDGIAKQIEAVRAAMSTFNGKLHTPEDGDIVRIVSAAVSDDGETGTAYGNYVCATSADTVGNIGWDYKDDTNADSRLDSYWQVNKQDDGTVALRNVGTGRYLANIYTGVADRDDVSLSQTTKSSAVPQYVTFTSGKKGGIFNITLTEGRYLNADPNGGIANWNNGDNNSLFTIEKAETDIVGDEYAVTVKANNIQVVTLPLATAGSPSNRYKVLGQKDNKLQLAAYGDDEVIAAGTPFVVQTTEEEDFIKVYPNATTVEELIEEGYEYGHIVQNGLVGTLNTLKVKAGLGLIIDNVVKNSVDNTTVNAGSGYFTSIPETTEEGDLQVEITEVINGIAGITAATDAAADVYSITGVKVRNGKSVKNLPAGLYIIGGKKVLVK